MGFLNKLSHLGNLFRQKKEEKYFLAVELGNEQIKIAAWQPKGKEGKIFWLEQKDWNGDFEEAAKIIDEAIFKFEEKIPSAGDLTKVIFGLPPTFSEKDKIKEPYLSNLKTLAGKLSLQPFGFVEVPQAIAFFLEKEEGSPQTMILVSSGKLEIIASLFKVGKMVDFKVSARSDEVAKDLEEAFKKFSDVEILPSRIFLYDEEENLEEIKEKLLSYPWQKKAAFLHFPKIEVLPPDISIKSVVFAGASQMTLPAEEAVAPTVSPKKAKISLPAFGFSLPHLPHFPHLPLFLFGLALFLGIGIFSYYLLPKAEIKILVDPKILEEEEKIYINQKISSADIKNKEIPGRTIETQITQSLKGQTTGKKNIGEKARGEVAIYNKTASLKIFKEGTIIVGSNNLKFSLDDEAKVSSASENVDHLTFGKNNVKVSALSIGPEGNLKEGTEFIFESLPSSSYSVRNDSPFSGGTSREVKVFSEADASRLAASLSAQITQKAKEELRQKLSPGESLLEKGIVSSVNKKTFSSKINEETTEVTAELTMNISGIAYKEEDLNNLLEEEIASLVPPGFEFNKEASKIDIEEAVSYEEGKTVFMAKIKAFLLPKIPVEEIKRNLVGKDLSAAKIYLKGVENVAGALFGIDSPFSFLGQRLPMRQDNIKIVVNPR